jgi:hypothetical protein
MIAKLLSLALLCSMTLASQPPPPDKEILEPIHAFKVLKDTLKIGVFTSGYTSEKSFKVLVVKAEKEKRCTLKLLRIRRDEGKMMPMPMEITYKLQDLKIDPHTAIKVENHFSENWD